MVTETLFPGGRPVPPRLCGVSPARPSRVLRWVRRGVTVVAAAIAVMLVALVLAMFLNDRTIDGDRIRTTATVLAVSPLRTGVEFVDQNGLTVRPSTGVLYPGLLHVGQQFVVEYSAAHPEIVRVAGRTAVNGLLMVLFAAIGTAVITALSLVVLGRYSARVGRRLRAVG